MFANSFMGEEELRFREGVGNAKPKALSDPPEYVLSKLAVIES